MARGITGVKTLDVILSGLCEMNGKPFLKAKQRQGQQWICLFWHKNSPEEKGVF
jgi:hypothetical protein